MKFITITGLLLISSVSAKFTRHYEQLKESYPPVPSTPDRHAYERFTREILDDPNHRSMLLSYTRDNVDNPVNAEIVRLSVGIATRSYTFARAGQKCEEDTGGISEVARAHQRRVRESFVGMPKMKKEFKYFVERVFDDILDVMLEVIDVNNKKARTVCEYESRLLACQRNVKGELRCDCVIDTPFNLTTDIDDLCQIKIGHTCMHDGKFGIEDINNNSRPVHCASTSHCNHGTTLCECTGFEEYPAPLEDMCIAPKRLMLNIGSILMLGIHCMGLIGPVIVTGILELIVRGPTWYREWKEERRQAKIKALRAKLFPEPELFRYQKPLARSVVRSNMPSSASSTRSGKSHKSHKSRKTGRIRLNYNFV